MKKLEFMELNAQELEDVNGGGMAGPSMSRYLDADGIAQATRAIGKAFGDAWDYIRGFGAGFF